MKLSEAAEIFGGKSVKKNDDNGNITVLRITNIDELGINYNDVEHTELTMRKASAYIIKEGDILLTARSTTIKTAIFHEQSFPCIANVSLIVIRPKKCLNSAYLKLFLDSKEGNRLIKEKKQRSCSDKMIALSYKNLGEIDIPIPDLEKQEQKALKYQTELDLFVKAKKRWENALADLIEN